MSAKMPPPQGLADGGRALWREVLDKFELSPAEVVLLEEACRVRDELDALHIAIGERGVVSKGSMGQTTASPLLSAANSARTSLSRLLGQLDVLDDSDEDAKKEAKIRADTARTAAARAARWGAVS